MSKKKKKKRDPLYTSVSIQEIQNGYLLDVYRTGVPSEQEYFEDLGEVISAAQEYLEAEAP